MTPSGKAISTAWNTNNGCAGMMLLFLVLAISTWPCDQPLDAGIVHAHIVHAQAPPPAEAGVHWRRTINGWERADLWNVGSFAQGGIAVRSGPTAPLPTPGVHPIFVALFMLGAAGLLSIGEQKNARSRPSND